MRKVRSPLTTLFILFNLCCLLAIGCARSTLDVAGTSGTGNGRLTLGTTAVIRTLDPADAYELFSGELLYNLGDRLYTYESGTTNLKPQLATALPQVSADGLTYTIPLRQGVMFHDGTPFNAQAMEFSLKRFMENGGAPSFLLTDVVESVQATAEYELTVKLQKPFVAFPAVLAFTGACAISPKAYEIGEGKFQPSQFVGTGPYKLARYGSDSIALDAFEQYWGEKPANQGIDIQFLSSSANLFNAFKSRAVDLAYQNLDIDQVLSLQKGAEASGWQVLEGAGAGIYYLSVNVKSPPLDSVENRRRIAELVDRNLLQDRVFRGQVEPLYSLIPTTSDLYKPVFQTIDAPQTVVSQTKSSETNPLQVDFWYRSNITSNQLASTTLKASIQRYSEDVVQVKLDGVESATAYTNLDKGVYPIFMLDWTPDFFDPDNYIQPFLACTKGSAETGCEEGASHLQGSFYYNDRVNQLIDQERREQDPQRRKQIFAEIQDILAEDIPFIPLWQNKEYLFAQKGISGAKIEPTQKVPFWTIRKS
jgi:peptide/nickel transport system substrate-binding protein